MKNHGTGSSQYYVTTNPLPDEELESIGVRFVSQMNFDSKSVCTTFRLWMPLAKGTGARLHMPRAMGIFWKTFTSIPKLDIDCELLFSNKQHMWEDYALGRKLPPSNLRVLALGGTLFVGGMALCAEILKFACKRSLVAHESLVEELKGAWVGCFCVNEGGGVCVGNSPHGSLFFGWVLAMYYITHWIL